MDPTGFEPVASTLRRWRSSGLIYGPICMSKASGNGTVSRELKVYGETGPYMGVGGLLGLWARQLRRKVQRDGPICESNERMSG